MTRVQPIKTMWALALALSLPAVASATLRDLDGRVRQIEEFTGRGQWTVVMIWASDCMVCNAEAHRYVDFHTFHQDEDAGVLGISMDGQDGLADAQAFIQEHSVNFPNLIGEPEDVAAMYTRLTGRPWRGTPTFLIYGPDGELRAQQVGAVPTEVIVDFIARGGEQD
ncbi:MAG: TlpA family protein disulfide reductase [Gammaproteobacteria bacterium]|nr:TlpA family protein disulfide reductase [Gammaproteobacteria bacterium]NIR98865.1 TlpA family protein disulfide reductase [Gammaproteobacteria bacterium]NIT63986.1 TlpA family protein disulfide reductase [Gammaproteobacteria bacterium]NIV19146.1 redoxin domain-containing protein [Gammaproteobacteria bacterium]NIX10315.1 redoxin domain-containing protein [Gammaproteobacteria bacterium]